MLTIEPLAHRRDQLLVWCSCSAPLLLAACLLPESYVLLIFAFYTCPPGFDARSYLFICPRVSYTVSFGFEPLVSLLTWNGCC